LLARLPVSWQTRDMTDRSKDVDDSTPLGAKAKAYQSGFSPTI
jgi:hypothetical protein